MLRSASILATIVVGVAISHAQPDVERAKQLYAAAQQAMAEGRYADAVRDYGGAYEITRDPVLFYKIGNANEKAGKCDVALTYYGRYLKEAQPAPDFVKLTQERIAACGGAASEPARPAEPTPPTPADPKRPPEPPSPEPAPPAPPPPTDRATPAQAAPIKAKHQGPWLLVGGSLAMITVGAVLAYSAEASENDLQDLYVGLQGTPPVFDARTQRRYNDLIAEGERYERLSWASFAIAGGLAVGAAIWFYMSPSSSTVVMPTVREREAGVEATVRF